MRLERLPEGVTCRLYALPEQGAPLGEALFESRAKWLHPLFELEGYLAGHPGLDPAGLFLRDRVIGSAAALLILRLGLGAVETDLAGRRALGLLRARGVTVEAQTTVEAVACMTEQLLKDEADPVAAYPLLAERRRLALQRMGS